MIRETYIFRVYVAVFHRASVNYEASNTFADMILASFDFGLMRENSIELKRVGLIQLIRVWQQFNCVSYVIRKH
jgi:hypothetical protein